MKTIFYSISYSKLQFNLFYHKDTIIAYTYVMICKRYSSSQHAKCEPLFLTAVLGGKSNGSHRVFSSFFQKTAKIS